MTAAYKAWIELATRKAAIPFDEEHDLILEVYNSWYALFGELRSLAKSMPAQLLRRDAETRRLVEVMVDVLNRALRPHLTRWRARFCKWYKSVEDKYPDMSPQEVQRLFPEYAQLVADLKDVNSAMVRYADWLRRVAEGDGKHAFGPAAQAGSQRTP